jgi:hypothetical protein
MSPELLGHGKASFSQWMLWPSIALYSSRGSIRYATGLPITIRENSE